MIHNKTMTGGHNHFGNFFANSILSFCEKKIAQSNQVSPDGKEMVCFAIPPGVPVGPGAGGSMYSVVPGGGPSVGSGGGGPSVGSGGGGPSVGSGGGGPSVGSGPGMKQRF